MGNVVARQHSGYFGRAFGNLDGIAVDLGAALRGVEYDTMIGTGLSGALVVPGLARMLDKHWAIVRKPGDSQHTSATYEGEIGERWLFVDDFVSSGATLARVRTVIEGLWVWQERPWARVPVLSTYVGTFQYEGDRYGRPAFMPA